MWAKLFIASKIFFSAFLTLDRKTGWAEKPSGALNKVINVFRYNLDIIRTAHSAHMSTSWDITQW